MLYHKLDSLNLFFSFCKLPKACPTHNKQIENQIMTEYEMLTLDLVGFMEHTMRSSKVQLSGSRPK